MFKIMLFSLSTIICSQQAIASVPPTPEQLYTNVPSEMSPDLAKAGGYSVGVRTMEITDKNYYDPFTNADNKTRTLKLEVWYPGSEKVNSNNATTYDNVTRSGQPFSIIANAVRNSAVVNTAGKFPLIILSHGYTGYRTIMFYLGEHLASNGYIVVGIDHTDSTNAEVDFKSSPYSGFPSTLINRSRDQEFTKKYFNHNKTFLSGVLDTQKSGLIGYSMGGYGAIKSAGGCYHFSDQNINKFMGVKDIKVANDIKNLLNKCPSEKQRTSHWDAVIAMDPWGEAYRLFSLDSLAKITTPLLYVAGDLDDVADYKSIVKLYNNTGSKNTFLLTYENARHNTAPHPAPAIAYKNAFDLGHYDEPTWDTQKLNTINKHFALAMMDCYVKNIAKQCKYLSLPERSNADEDHPWFGFDKRYSVGMEWKSKMGH